MEIYTTHNLRSKHYRSRIEEIHSDHLVLAMPFDKGVPIFTSAGATIYGRVMADSVPYLFVSQYIGKKISPLPVWLVSCPVKVIKLQQREHVRIDIKIPASVTLLDQEAEQAPMKMLINDISGGGVRLVSQQPYPIGVNFLISFELPGPEVIETIGQVVRCEQPHPDQPIYWLGLKFVGLQERHRNKIIKYVFQIQLERHRRGF